MSTIFDKILQGEIPCQKVYENTTILAFNDINPVAPVHVIIIPKKKAQNMNDFKDWSTKEIGTLFQGAYEVVAFLKLETKGYHILINNGEQAGQTVPYLHLHLLSGPITKLPF